MALYKKDYTTYYKVNPWNTDIEECYVVKQPDTSPYAMSYDYSEKKGYYKNKHKAQYVMLMNRLEKEPMKKRQNKIKIKINTLLDEYPECVI